MPATALTVTTNSAYSEGLADVGYEAADQANGNSAANDERTRLLIKNGSGGNVTCTVTATAGPANYNEAFTKTLTVATTDTGMMGPFPIKHFSSTLSISWDTDTSITVAAVSDARTPSA